MLTKPKHRHTLTLAVLIIALYGCTAEEAVSTEPSCDIEACRAQNAGPRGRTCFMLVHSRINLERRCLEDGEAVACEDDVLTNASVSGLEASGHYLIESPDGECWYAGNSMFPKGWRQINSVNPPTSICEPYLDYFYYEIPRNCSAYPDYVPPKDLTTGGAP